MSFLQTHVVLPFAEPDRYAGLPGRLRAIRQFERMSEQNQRRAQQQRLRRLLEHAYATVPYYRKQFDNADFHPSDARIGQPLALPALTRDDLRRADRALLSTAFNRRDLRRAATSGTVGAPIQFYRDLEGLRNKNAMQLRLNASASYEPGDSVLTLWAAHPDLAIPSHRRWRVYDEGRMHRIPTPGGILNQEILERFRERYEEQQPRVLYAYTTVLAAFAGYLREHGIKHRPRVVIASAEVMSDANRKLIEAVFGVPVTMFYGNREVGVVAAECTEHEGLHFHPWSSYVEFDPIGDTANGPAYRLLITDLLNYGQPFIRYDTGDIVTMPAQRCSCRSWFPTVDAIIGHAEDVQAMTGSNKTRTNQTGGVLRVLPSERNSKEPPSTDRGIAATSLSA